MSNQKPGLPVTPDEEIAHKVRHALTVNNMTQQELADAAGISFPTLRRSIAREIPNRRSLTFKEFGAIAKALDTPPTALYPRSLSEVN